MIPNDDDEIFFFPFNLLVEDIEWTREKKLAIDELHVLCGNRKKTKLFSFRFNNNSVLLLFLLFGYEYNDVT